MKALRNHGTPYIRSVRPMVRADVESLRAPSSRERISKLRDSHHIVARLAVSGLTNIAIAAETGYSIVRISQLLGAPAMQELMARYRADDNDSWRKSRDATYEFIHSAGLKAWRQINDALDDEENPVAMAHLLKIADSSSDRVGYHRKSTKENINIDFAARLEAAIVRSQKVIE